jgi:hypothetical protein
MADAQHGTSRLQYILAAGQHLTVCVFREERNALSLSGRSNPAWSYSPLWSVSVSRPNPDSDVQFRLTDAGQSLSKTKNTEAHALGHVEGT